MLFSFGENGKLGKIDFSKLVEGLTKEDLGIQDSKFEASLFDMVDTDSQKGVLNQKELISCTKCNYCLDECPQNITISKNSELHNQVQLTNGTATDELKEKKEKYFG